MLSMTAKCGTNLHILSQNIALVSKYCPLVPICYLADLLNVLSSISDSNHILDVPKIPFYQL